MAARDRAIDGVGCGRVNTFGGSSGQSIDFSGAASASQGRPVEMKICECCAGRFFRPVPELAKLGQKYCGKCAKAPPTDPREIM